MTEHEINEIMRAGILLSSERNLNRLLDEVLTCAMEAAHCDAGTLYLLEDNALHFKIMRNNTLKTYSGGDDNDIDLPPVALQKGNVCALSLLEDRTIRIADVRTSTEADFSGPVRYDSITGYHTRSMLVVPMRNRDGDKLGVVQLLNCLDENGNVTEFPEEMALMVEWVASQSAISIQNARYVLDIKELFQSVVRMMSSAVDERTPYNGNHTRHMAAYGERFLNFLNRRADEAGVPRPFSPAHREELLMSIWFHDIGKLITPLGVMNKDTRLLPEQRSAFAHRMEIIRLRGEIDCLSGRITPEEKQSLIQKTRDAEAIVEKCNPAGFLSDEDLAAIDRLADMTYEDGDGRRTPWLTADEHTMLSIRKGTLSEKEREIMEDHVVVTDKLLTQIHFSKDFSHVRDWAGSHHEYINGTGYPRHLSGDQIPPEVRIITILDIFDALTADDRPYKPGIPVENALSILDSMANNEGKLDPELTRLFIESQCWKGTLQ